MKLFYRFGARWVVGELPLEDYLNGGVLNQVSIQHYLGFKDAGFRALFQAGVELSEKYR
jgi:hypothetical protein